MKTRTEKDSLGTKEVPADAYYGVQTLRAAENFPVSGWRFPRRFIRALALVKKAAALANGRLCRMPKASAEAIARAAGEAADGRFDDQFLVDVFQTGSGTSTNMNMNEVLAHRANEILGKPLGSKSPVHPNDEVNRGQSSNDVIPTALHLAALESLVQDVVPALETLRGALEEKAKVFDGVLKIGRTHLQDAVPMRLGQEFGAWASQIDHGIARLKNCRAHLAELALGGTAVGTGLNTDPAFVDFVIAELAKDTGLPFIGAPNRFEALAARDAAVETSGALRTVAVSLTKIANDLRWLSSGPRCGLGELELPALQPGSSIMPGKINPVIPEAVLMAAAWVIGADAAVAVGGLSGNLQLNAMQPLIIYNLLWSMTLIANASRLLAERCVKGIKANKETAEAYVEISLSIATALAPRLGYDKAAEIAKESVKTGKTVREICRESQVLPEDELSRLLDVRGMTGSG